jgi:uncharacterized protein
VWADVGAHDGWVPDVPGLWVLEVRMTPCIRKCSAKGGVCTGCGRTLDEIARWARMTPEEREAVMRRLERQTIDTLPQVG